MAVMPHIHEEHQDMGSCGSPSGFMRPGDISLTHWGMADCIPSDTTMIVVPPGVRRSPKLKRTDSRWVAVDPELVSTAKRAYAPDRIHSPRVRQLFFRGSTREDKIPPEVASACLRLNRSTDDRRCIDGFYSLGIRQMVKALIGRHQMVSFMLSSEAQWSYHHNLLTSEFTSPGWALVFASSTTSLRAPLSCGRDHYAALEPELGVSTTFRGSRTSLRG